MVITLRQYQEEAISSLYDYWKAGKGKHPLIVMPTGSGKSLVNAEFIRRTIESWPDVRICCLVDSRELIAQNESELKKLWPEARTGIYSAGLNSRDLNAQILFAGIQSIYQRAFDVGKIDIIIVDEAHMIPRDADTRYGQFLNDAKLANPKLVVIGLTATPYRLDSGMLHEGEDALFDGIAYNTDLNKLITNGYLVPIVSKGGEIKINLDGVKVRMGDYAPGELEQAANNDHVVVEAVCEIIKYGQSRCSWLVFAAGVAHAEHLLREFSKRGIASALVTGSTPKHDRDRIIDGFKNMNLKCLINVGVFTKGFNAPCCDLIALLTATKSTGKYVQMVGRGMRTFPGKSDCLLLDYGSNVITHGPIDTVEPVSKNGNGKGEGHAPARECPNCHEIIHISIKVCPECGYEFPASAPHGTNAYGGAVLSKQEQPQWYNVNEVDYKRHQKQGKPDSIRCDFTVSDRAWPFSMWLALDHGGYATKRALQYIQACGGASTNVDDALREQYHWKDPSRILVKRNGKYFEIIGFDFPDEEKDTQSILE